MHPQDHQDGAGEQPVPHYLSQSDIAGAAGVSTAAVSQAITRGLLTPDARIGKTPGFKADNATVVKYIARDRRRPSIK